MASESELGAASLLMVGRTWRTVLLHAGQNLTFGIESEIPRCTQTDFRFPVREHTARPLNLPAGARSTGLVLSRCSRSIEYQFISVRCWILVERGIGREKTGQGIGEPPRSAALILTPGTILEMPASYCIYYAYLCCW